MAETDAPSGPRRQEQEPATTEITEVAPGILRSQLPIMLPGLGHVNCYFLEDERGVAIVDPGMPGPQSWRALVDRLKRAGYKPKDVHTVVVTHSHPDHFGGAGPHARHLRRRGHHPPQLPHLVRPAGGGGARRRRGAATAPRPRRRSAGRCRGAPTRCSARR